MQTNPTPPFLPTALPELLLQLAEQFDDQTTPAGRQTAAAGILKEYFSCYQLAEVRQLLWQLLSGSLANGKMVRLKKAAERYELIFFYEFTLMLMDAAACLNEAGQGEVMVVK